MAAQGKLITVTLVSLVLGMSHGASPFRRLLELESSAASAPTALEDSLEDPVPTELPGGGDEPTQPLLAGEVCTTEEGGAVCDQGLVCLPVTPELSTCQDSVACACPHGLKDPNKLIWGDRTCSSVATSEGGWVCNPTEESQAGSDYFKSQCCLLTDEDLQAAAACACPHGVKDLNKPIWGPSRTCGSVAIGEGGWVCDAEANPAGVKYYKSQCCTQTAQEIAAAAACVCPNGLMDPEKQVWGPDRTCASVLGEGWVCEPNEQRQPGVNYFKTQCCV